MVRNAKMRILAELNLNHILKKLLPPRLEGFGGSNQIGGNKLIGGERGREDMR